jgi:spore germination cell wall hydrolase CwlJ-like protein
MQINRVESKCNQIKLSNIVFMNKVWYLGQFEPTLHVVHFLQVRSKILQKHPQIRPLH